MKANLLMEALEITIELASPVVMSAPWIMLDGLLLYGMGQLIFGKDWQSMASSSNVAMWRSIPVPVEDARDGDGLPVYRASCSRFDPPARGSVSFFQHFSTENLDGISPRARKQRYMIVGGEFKQSAKTYPIITSKRVRFWCKGDFAFVSMIVSAMEGIGKRIDAGFGRVASSTVSRIRGDLSITHPEFGLNRPIPLRFAPGLGLAMKPGVSVATVSFHPPYWMQEHHEPCFVPEGFA